jgi:hypothetical protein
MKFHQRFVQEIKREEEESLSVCVCFLFLFFQPQKEKERKDKEIRKKGESGGIGLGYYFQNQIPPTHLVSQYQTKSNTKTLNKLTSNITVTS